MAKALTGSGTVNHGVLIEREWNVRLITKTRGQSKRLEVMSTSTVQGIELVLTTRIGLEGSISDFREDFLFFFVGVIVFSSCFTWAYVFHLQPISDRESTLHLEDFLLRRPTHLGAVEHI